MKQLAFLEYTYVFEPTAQTWQRGFEFEKDLADFFAAHGLEANIVETVGGSGRRVIYIAKIEDKLDKLRQAEEKPKGIQQALKNVTKQAQMANTKRK